MAMPWSCLGAGTEHVDVNAFHEEDDVGRYCGDISRDVSMTLIGLVSRFILFKTLAGLARNPSDR